VMLAIAAYLSRVLWQQIPQLLNKPQTRAETVVLGSVLLVILAEYLLLVYGFHKDLTLAPRYAFVFYPLLCALVGVVLAQFSGKITGPSNLQVLPWLVLLIGIISTGCVVNDLAFLKPFQPQRIAQRFLKTSDPTLIVLQSYQGTQDIALGLSSALAVQQFRTQPGLPQTIQWGFGADQEREAWVGRSPLPIPITLWRVGALNQKKTAAAAPIKIVLADSTLKKEVSCLAHQSVQIEMGVQYQPFQCKNKT
jgi:hypothetical protein